MELTVETAYECLDILGCNYVELVGKSVRGDLPGEYSLWIFTGESPCIEGNIPKRFKAPVDKILTKFGATDYMDYI